MRAYLALARVSNLPTVWTNVLAAAVLASSPLPAPHILVLLALAVSLIYCAGMVFNDVADVEEDARERPSRPIPSGRITRGGAATFGLLLTAAGVIVLLLVSRDQTASIPWIAALVLAIAYYDLRHQRDPLGPVVMGACRGLVYLVVAAVLVGQFWLSLLVGAAVMTAYVTLLTLVAKFGGARYGWSIKYLIAGICIVDALVIAGTGRWDLAVVAALGVPATLAAQRIVSGT